MTLSGERWGGVGAIGAMAAVVAASVTWWVLGAYLPSFNTPRTSLSGVAPARGPIPPAAIARSVTVVVVDGISFERARAAGAWKPLFAAGVARPLAAPFPSYTYPALTALATGVPPRESGVRLNGPIVGPDLDSLARAAEDAGLAVRVRSRGWSPFETLVRPGPRAEMRLGRATSAVETTLRLVTSARPGRALELVYIGDPDDAAHDHHESSAEYAESIEAAGLAVQRRLATLDPSEDALVIVSDHGHRRGVGGHGGVEPEVLDSLFVAIGAGLARGVSLPRRHAEDVAPTVALLGGFAAPAASFGRPMSDAFVVAEDRLGPLLAPQIETLVRRVCASTTDEACERLPATLDALARGRAGAALAADTMADSVLVARDRAIAGAVGDARARRLGLAGGALGLGAVMTTGIGLRHRSRAGPHRARREAESRLRSVAAAACWPLLVVAVYAAAMAARGYRVSFSTLPPMGVFMRDSFLAAGGAVVLVVLGMRWLRAASDRAAWMLIAGSAAPYALVATWVGADPRHLVPPIEGALVFFLAPIVAMAALGAVAVAWLARRAA